MKTDFKKELDCYKATQGQYDLIDVPPMQYLCIDGDGGPQSEDFSLAIETLYPVAYNLKFGSKQRDRDYVVPPLEALWWADDMTAFTTNFDKSKWQWTAMLMLPNWIQRHAYEGAIREVFAKKNPPKLADLELRYIEEDMCMQTLHIGPFDNEGPVIKEMHEVHIPQNECVMTGKHHEIYFSDFRNTDPENQRTILRQPVKFK